MSGISDGDLIFDGVFACVFGQIYTMDQELGLGWF